MRAVLIAWLVGVAGCSDGIGAYVEVTTDDPLIDRLEIYMAPNECAPDATTPTCSDQLTWDDALTPRMGKLFILDSEAAVTEFQRDADGHLQFSLRSPDGDERSIKRIMIIGFHGTDPTPVAAARLKNVTIPAARGEQWNVTLEPVTDIPVGDPVIEHGTRVHRWSRSTAGTKCLVYQEWFDSVSSQEFLVSPIDSDCDALLNVEVTECQPFRYNVDAPALGKRCAVKGPLDPGACTVGSSTCASDGGPACSQLLPQKCLPDRFCSAGCEKLDASCFSSTLGSPTTIPHFVCTFPNDQALGRCPNNISDDVSLQVGGSLPCINVGYNDEPRLEQPVVDSFMVGTAAMTVTRDVNSTECKAQVTWAGGARSVGEHRGLIGFELAGNGNTIYLPIIVNFEAATGGACPTSPLTICRFIANSTTPVDHVFDCIQ